MANWNLPTITSGYLDFVTEMNAKFTDAATLQFGSPINFPDNTIRFNRSINVFQEWLGAATGWQDKILGIAGGGTGAATAGDIRINLGLGSMSTQNSNLVNITGGSITGVTFDVSSATGILPLARGGTGNSLVLQVHGSVLMSYSGLVQFAHGVNIAQLDAGSLIQGTVPLARLSGVGKLTEYNTWAAGTRNTFAGQVLFTGTEPAWVCTIFQQTNSPNINFYGAAGSAGRKWTRIVVVNGDFIFQKLDDSYGWSGDLCKISWDGVLYGNGGGLYGLNAGYLGGTVPIATLGTNPGSANSGTFLRGDNTWQTVATGGTGTPIPTGLIAMFDSACPAGWTRVTALDGRMPLGSTSYGGFGGSIGHSHGFDVTSSNNGGHSHSFGGNFGGSGSGSGNASGQTGGESAGSMNADAGASGDVSRANHVHGFNVPVNVNVNVTTNVQGDTSGVGDHAHRVAGQTSDTTHYPPHMGVIFCRKD